MPEKSKLPTQAPFDAGHLTKKISSFASVSDSPSTTKKRKIDEGERDDKHKKQDKSTKHSELPAPPTPD